MKFSKRAIRKIKFIWGFVRSLIMGCRHSKRYRAIRSFVIFVGYPRSGHSLIAALLDAHPNAVISMEWGALGHLHMGYGKLQLFYAIERLARLFTNRLNNIWTDYSYKVEGLWQGESNDIRVIGDKLASQTSLVLMEYPELLGRLQNEIQMDLKLIHVIRNPFDTISTWGKRSMEKSDNPEGDPDLYVFTEKYFKRVQLVTSLKASEGISIYDFYHEDLIKQPEESLKNLLSYLGLQPVEDYLEKCAKIVYESPHKSRHQYMWPENLVEKIHSRINSYDFLKRYTFSN